MVAPLPFVPVTMMIIIIIIVIIIVMMAMTMAVMMPALLVGVSRGNEG
jgi:hypothetical protein